jgi:hypothetical protein
MVIVYDVSKGQPAADIYDHNSDQTKHRYDNLNSSQQTIRVIG